MKNYESTIKALHDQADALGEDDRESRTVTERLNSIDKRYQELQELAKLRKQRLLDALSLYKLFTEADGVEQWINEKEKMLVTMVPGMYFHILGMIIKHPLVKKKQMAQTHFILYLVLGWIRNVQSGIQI